MSELIRQVFGPGTAFKIIVKGDLNCAPVVLHSWERNFGCADQTADIECGNASQGLCALTVPDAQTVAWFFQHNPGAAGTLVTTIAEMHVIWLRIVGWFPKAISYGGMNWQSSESLPVSNLNMDTATSSVVITPFASLRWPPPLDFKFYEAKILHESGPYYQVTNLEKTVLNPATFARIIMYGKGITFDADSRTFQQQVKPEEPSKLISSTAVFEMVRTCLGNVAGMNANSFPKDELNLITIHSIIEHIKLATAFTRPNAAESLIKYARSRLCVKGGSNLTVEEIHSDYVAHIHVLNLVLIPKSKFYVELPKVMLAELGTLRSNNLKRLVPGTSQATARRGFHGVTFKKDGADAVDGRDGMDDADGTVG